MKKVRKLIIYIGLVSLFATSVLHAEDINQITYTYDENNQLTEKLIVAKDGVHYQMKYEYDSNGNQLKRKYGIRNFLENGDFESEVMDPWDVWIPAGSIGSAELVQTNVYDGDQAIKLSASGTPLWQSTLLTQTTQLDSKQQSFTYSGYVEVEQLTGALLTLSVRFLDENSQYISKQTKDMYSTNGYEHFELIGMTPANVRYVQVEVHIKASQPNGSGTVYVDALKFEYAASSVPAPTDVLLLAKSDKTIDLSWNTVLEAEAYEIYKGTVLAGTSTNTSYTVAGLMPSTTYDISIRAKDAEGYVSIPSTALSVTTEAAGANLLTNGGFDTVTGDAGWTLWLPPTATGELVAVDTPIDSGVHAFKLSANGLAQWEIAYIRQTVDVEPNMSFKLKAALQIEQNTNTFVVYRALFKDANGQYISHQQSENYVVSAEYAPLEIIGMTPPNAATVVVDVQVKATQTGGGATAYVDALSLAYAEANISAPTNVILLSKTDKTVDVAWDVVMDATEYEIYNGATRVGTSTNTSYTVAGLTPSTAYDISIRSKDAEGYVSLPSTALSMTTEAASANLLTNGGFDSVTGDAGWTLWLPPTATGELSAVNTPIDSGVHAFKLSANGLAQWELAYIRQTEYVEPNMSFKLKAALQIEQNTNTFVVYRALFKDANGQYISHQQSENYLVTEEYIPLEIIGMTPPNAATVVVEVQVKATQTGGGATAYVDALSLAYAEANISAPTNVILLSKTDKTVDVAWDVVMDATEYEIYNGATLVGTSTNTSYTVAGLTPSTTYDISIRAKDSEGYVSLPSTALSVTTEVASANLLTNGGFDTVTGNAGWTLWLPPTATGELVAVDTPIDSGVHAFKLSANGLAQWEIAYIRQTVDVEPNESYTLKAALNIQQLDNALVTFRVLFKDLDGQYISHEQVDTYYATSGYVPLEIQGMTPEFAVTADIGVQVKASQTGGGGLAYVDSLSIEYEWVPKNLAVPNKTDNSIDLVWQAPTNDSVVAEYEIYQDDNLVGTSPTTQFTAIGLSPTTLYHFTVKAKHTDGLLSVASNELKVATKPLPGYYSIMPLGASITDGYNVPGGYRNELWNKLIVDGFFIDYVGSQTNGPSTLPDQDHEGHPGWRIDEIYAQLDEWLVYEPQMVVVHLGTNDMFDNGQASTAGQDLQQLIDKVTNLLPNTQVVVSSIVMLPINNFERNSYVLNYNALIPGIVDSFRDQGKLVTYVDMYQALDINDFSPDMIHPSSEGYDKMAVVWYDAIQAILTSSEKDPMKPENVQLVSNDGSSATFSWSASSDNVGVITYDIYQDGVWFATTINTQFTVTNLPANSTLSYTVVAKDAAGNLSLPSDEVVVSNALPADTEAPTAPTGLQATVITDTSIRITWNASSDNVGVLGYNIYRNGIYYDYTEETNFIVTDLLPSTTYTFTVRAYDVTEHESADSTELVVTTPTTLFNLVINQGFETDGLSPWSLWGGGNGTIVSDSPHDGLYELRISPQSGGQQDLVGYELNQTYTIGAWGRISVAGQTAKVVISGTGVNQMIEFTNTSYEYKSIQFTSPSDALSWLAVQFWNGSTADFYIDDVQVYIPE